MFNVYLSICNTKKGNCYGLSTLTHDVTNQTVLSIT